MKTSIRAAAALAVLQAATPALAAPTTWDLFHRETWVQDRIDHGLRDGSLDRAEARRVQDELERIRRDESRDMRENNGQLAAADRASLEQKIDALSDNIRWARANAERRPW